MKKAIVSIICVLIGALLAQASINKRESKEKEESYNRPSIEIAINK